MNVKFVLNNSRLGVGGIHKMRKLIKNMRITHSIIMIVILATVFVAVVGGIGYRGIGSINDNVSQIYNEAVLKTQLATEITHKFMNIRIEVLRAIDLGYNPSIIRNIDNLDAELRELMDIYLEGQEESSMENVVLESAINNYNIFSNAWASIVTKLQRHEELDDQDRFSLEARGSAILSNLVFIVNNNKEFAEKLYDESKGIYDANVKGLSTIGFVALVTLLSFSFLIIGLMKKSINEMKDIFEVVATGDFTSQIDTNQRNEFGLMKKSLSSTLKDVSSMIDNMKNNITSTNNSASALASICEQMTAASQEVASSIQEVAKGSNSQADDLARISEIVNNFGEELEATVLSIQNIYENTKKTDTMISQGNGKLQQLIDSTQTISESFNEVSDHVKMLDHRLEEIGEITHAINSISDQTNLLALNAAIEAARAGEAGKGFAVVADEIRKLAEQSKNSSVHINELLSNITNSSAEIIETTTKGIDNLKGQEEVVHSTISSFKEILADIANIIPMIENANNSINIVDESKNDIVTRVDTIAAISVDNSAIAQQIAASSEEMSASVEEIASTAQVLNEMTYDMKKEVEKFKV